MELYSYNRIIIFKEN